MSAGKRNRLVRIERPLTIASDTGSRSVVWEHVTSVYGYKRDMPRGENEKTHSSTLYPIKKVQWVIRYTRGLQPSMRLVYTENERTEVWEIIAVTDHDYNRSEMLLLCELRGEDVGEQGSCPTLAEQVAEADWNEIKSVMNAGQIQDAVDDLCSAPTCEDARYENSDGSFGVDIPSGGLFVSEDISVTQVDGSVDEVPSNVGVVCDWKVLQLGATDGYTLPPPFNVTTYPAGGVLAVPDLQFEDGIPSIFGSFAYRPRVEISTATIASVITFGTANQITLALIEIINSDGLTLLLLPDFIGNKTLADTPLSDDNGAVGNFPVPTSIVIDGEVDTASYAAGVLTIKPVGGGAPSNIIPNRVIPNFITFTDIAGDLGWQWANGTYDYDDPAGIVQELDPTAGTEYWFRLKHDNPFGNKFRFTDDMGVPAPLGRFDFPGSISTPNSTGATAGYFIDHLTGLGWTTMPVAATKNYTDSMILCNNFILGAYSGFRMPSVMELRSLAFLDSLIYAVNDGTNPFFRQGINSHDPTGTGNVTTIWYNQMHGSATRGGTMSSFRLRTSDSPLTNTAGNGTYAVRKHY